VNASDASTVGMALLGHSRTSQTVPWLYCVTWQYHQCT